MPALRASASSDGSATPRLPARVLVVGPSWLGDSIMTMPAVRGLRRRLPAAHIAILAKVAVAEVWRLSGDVDEVLVLQTGTAGSLRTIRALRERRFDRAYILPRSVRSALIPFMAGIPSRRGLDGHRGRWLLTEVVVLPPESGREHQYREYTRLMGVEDGAPVVMPLISVTPGDGGGALDAAGVAAEDATLVGLFAGAARGPAKQWPAERFAEVARRLQESHGSTVLLLGSAADAEGSARIAARLKGKTVDLCGRTTLRELAAAVSRCRVVIANDSGGMHLAAGLGVPVVGIFGVTDPSKTGPLGSACRVVMADVASRRRDIPRHSLQARSALLSIRVEDVYGAAAEMLRNAGAGV